ncbi:MAG TPA: hypothetical protein VLL27_01780 [Solirubrobacterales bacterium]|nr:hypothetical protein [Solirubrobacterales bacterium]
MSIAITAKERNALYGEIVVRLSGIDALYRAVDAEDFEEAERLGREYCDYLLVLLNDLGWGGVSSASPRDFELTTAPEVLRRVLERLHVTASSQLETDKGHTRAAQADEALTEFVLTTCSGALEALANDGSGLQINTPTA